MTLLNKMIFLNYWKAVENISATSALVLAVFLLGPIQSNAYANSCRALFGDGSPPTAASSIIASKYPEILVTRISTGEFAIAERNTRDSNDQVSEAYKSISSLRDGIIEKLSKIAADSSEIQFQVEGFSESEILRLTSTIRRKIESSKSVFSIYAYPEKNTSAAETQSGGSGKQPPKEPPKITSRFEGKPEDKSSEALKSDEGQINNGPLKASSLVAWRQLREKYNWQDALVESVNLPHFSGVSGTNKQKSFQVTIPKQKEARDSTTGFNATAFIAENVAALPSSRLREAIKSRLDKVDMKNATIRYAARQVKESMEKIEGVEIVRIGFEAFDLIIVINRNAYRYGTC